MNEIEIYANFKLGDGYVNFNGFIGKFILLVLDLFFFVNDSLYTFAFIISFYF